MGPSLESLAGSEVSVYVLRASLDVGQCGGLKRG